MVNYLAIVEAIPQVELDACMAELDVEHPLIKRATRDVMQELIQKDPVLGAWWAINESLWNGKDIIEYPVLDDQGVEQTASGKFMDLTNVEAAFDAVKVLTSITVPSAATVTYKSISAFDSFDLASQLQKNILAAIAAGDLAQWIDDAFNDEGIDVKGSKFRTKIASLSGGHGFTSLFIDKLKVIGDVETVLFQGLKPGHVQNAIQKRHAGVI